MQPFFFCLSSLACQTLAVSQLDSVIIAPPGALGGGTQTLTDLQPAWEQLEALVRSQQIAAIGTSDLDKDLLERLYNWAQVSRTLLTSFTMRQILYPLKSSLSVFTVHVCLSL